MVSRWSYVTAGLVVQYYWSYSTCTAGLMVAANPMVPLVPWFALHCSSAPTDTDFL